ncbi:hypothetical protein ILYODFUR_033303 [Ilyodon furcidens]|uniref:Uncharacterized protein n=1 Tax=Ilyodon furcidens TaxID=33524 RepID=A0ABV0V9V7_9TELE
MNCNEQILRSGGKQQRGEAGSSVTKTKRRCNPEGSDGCDAGRTGCAEGRKPVVEVMIQSPQEAWNGKVNPQMIIKVRPGVRKTLEEGETQERRLVEGKHKKLRRKLRLGLEEARH